MFLPTDMEEAKVNDYLNSARNLTGRDTDFLLQLLYEHDFNVESTTRSLKKVSAPSAGYS